MGTRPRHSFAIMSCGQMAKKLHRELVLAGMERAKQRGKLIGRPRVSDRSGFEERFSEVVERIGTGELSRRKAAKELEIGYATLKRLLDAGGVTERPRTRKN